MEITGCDTVIFTTSDPATVFRSFLWRLAERWPEALISLGAFESPEAPFVQYDQSRPLKLPPNHWIAVAVRNSSMRHFFEDNAYALMPDGEGPFALWWRVRQGVVFQCDALGERSAGDWGELNKPPRPYSAWLCGATLNELTVVTPENPSADPFSEWVLESAIMACRSHDAADRPG